MRSSRAWHWKEAKIREKEKSVCTCLSVRHRLFVLHLVSTKEEEEVDQSSSARSVTEKGAREEKGWG
jgi:hypothetical protein